MGLAMSGMTINLGEGRIELADKTNTNVVKSKPFTPINPDTKEPYHHSVFEENDAVWAGRKVKPIKPK